MASVSTDNTWLEGPNDALYEEFCNFSASAQYGEQMIDTRLDEMGANPMDMTMGLGMSMAAHNQEHGSSGSGQAFLSPSSMAPTSSSLSLPAACPTDWSAVPAPSGDAHMASAANALSPQTPTSEVAHIGLALEPSHSMGLGLDSATASASDLMDFERISLKSPPRPRIASASSSTDLRQHRQHDDQFHILSHHSDHKMAPQMSQQPCQLKMAKSETTLRVSASSPQQRSGGFSRRLYNALKAPIRIATGRRMKHPGDGKSLDMQSSEIESVGEDIHSKTSRPEQQTTAQEGTQQGALGNADSIIGLGTPVFVPSTDVSVAGAVPAAVTVTAPPVKQDPGAPPTSSASASASATASSFSASASAPASSAGPVTALSGASSSLSPPTPSIVVPILRHSASFSASRPVMSARSLSHSVSHNSLNKSYRAGRQRRAVSHSKSLQHLNSQKAQKLQLQAFGSQHQLTQLPHNHNQQFQLVLRSPRSTSCLSQNPPSTSNDGKIESTTTTTTTGTSASLFPHAPPAAKDKLFCPDLSAKMDVQTSNMMSRDVHWMEFVNETQNSVFTGPTDIDTYMNNAAMPNDAAMYYNNTDFSNITPGSSQSQSTMDNNQSPGFASANYVPAPGAAFQGQDNSAYQFSVPGAGSMNAEPRNMPPFTRYNSMDSDQHTPANHFANIAMNDSIAVVISNWGAGGDLYTQPPAATQQTAQGAILAENRLVPMAGETTGMGVTGTPPPALNHSLPFGPINMSNVHSSPDQGRDIFTLPSAMPHSMVMDDSIMDDASMMMGTAQTPIGMPVTMATSPMAHASMMATSPMGHPSMTIPATMTTTTTTTAAIPPAAVYDANNSWVEPQLQANVHRSAPRAPSSSTRYDSDAQLLARQGTDETSAAAPSGNSRPASGGRQVSVSGPSSRRASGSGTSNRRASGSGPRSRQVSGSAPRARSGANNRSASRSAARSASRPAAARQNSRAGPATSDVQNEGPSPAFEFLNFTEEHKHIIMTGVAPSGSNKTRQRREVQAANEKRQLEEAAAIAIEKAGGDASLIRKLLP